MPVFFDHLVVAAQSLDKGVDWVRQITGVSVPPGGKHPQMATHNHVLALGSSRYLEIIATDPEARPPEQPRWFDLDDPHLKERLAKNPCLLTWIVRTNNLKRSIALAKNMGPDPGFPVAMSRGSLTWKIALRSDGRLLEQGLLPLLIEWAQPAVSNSGNTESLNQSRPPRGQTREIQHPAKAMKDAGLRLRTLELHHPEPLKIYDYLQGIGIKSPPRFLKFQEGACHLVAHFEDNEGKTRTLGSLA